jgi:hypothetical protein
VTDAILEAIQSRVLRPTARLSRTPLTGNQRRPRFRATRIASGIQLCLTQLSIHRQWHSTEFAKSASHKSLDFSASAIQNRTETRNLCSNGRRWRVSRQLRRLRRNVNAAKATRVLHKFPLALARKAILQQLATARPLGPLCVVACGTSVPAIRYCNIHCSRRTCKKHAWRSIMLYGVDARRSVDPDALN